MLYMLGCAWYIITNTHYVYDRSGVCSDAVHVLPGTRSEEPGAVAGGSSLIITGICTLYRKYYYTMCGINLISFQLVVFV